MTAVVALLIAPIAVACRSGVSPAGQPAPTVLAIGRAPHFVVTADFDGDGSLDLATVNADRTIAVWLHATRWTLGQLITLPAYGHLLAAADLDRDGHIDLIATAHDSGAVFVVRNQGRARFGEPKSYLAIAAAKPHNHGLAVDDLDGDGWPDAVVADQQQRGVVILRNDRSGQLIAQPMIALAGEPYPPAIGDLDGDGDRDIVVPLLSTSSVAVLTNDGTGRFATSLREVLRPRPYAVAVGDIDGDRRPDLVVSHDDSADLTVIASTQQHPQLVSLGLRLWQCVLADFDGDGMADLIGAGSGSFVIGRGDGRGGFAVPRGAPSTGWMVAIGDLDRDGGLDAVTPDPDHGAVQLWLSTHPR